MMGERFRKTDSCGPAYTRIYELIEHPYSHWNRIVLFNKIALDEDGNVEDPHYQTAAVYRRVAKHIENGCKRLVEQWKLQPPKPARFR